jgi:anti-sigma factor RsiW
MNGHLEAWIDAYLDGELTTAQKRQVEAHLAHCPACTGLVEQRRALSTLLQEAPATEGLSPEIQFLADVGLQLSRRQSRPVLPRTASSLTWLIIPVGLLLALIFGQTALTLSGVLSFIPGGNQALTLQAPGLASLQVMPGIVNNLISFSGVFNFIDWSWLTGLIFLAMLSVAYVGWLASWWARSQQSLA